MKNKFSYLWFSVLTVVLDQLSKALIISKIPLYSSIPLIPGCLAFTHVKNTGVAFGFLSAPPAEARVLLLSSLGLFALIVVFVYFWKTPLSDRWLLLSLALILGGAIGNLYDRITAGAVTDFIDFYIGTWHWHTFNVADSAISIGIGLMLIDSFFIKKEPEETALEA